jgi:hypothetical protein
MTSSPASRARFGLTLTLPILLVAGITVMRADAPSTADPAPPTPRFLTWSGDPHDDGLQHFIIATDVAAIETQGRLQRDGDGLLSVTATGEAAIEVTIDDLDSLLSGGATNRPVEEAEIVRGVSSLDGVVAARPIGFGMLAVAGDMAASDLMTVPGVVGVEPDARLAAASIDEYYPSQWALENDGTSPEAVTLTADADVDAPEAWHRTRGGGVVIAVIDSGVDTTHPDLNGAIWTNPGELCGNGIDDDANGYVDDCNGWDFANGDGGVEDHSGHGTHVAGIIAAQADNGIGIAGIAYDADVMVLKIGDGTPALSAAIEAFGYAIAHGARVINASWVVDEPDAAALLEPAIAAAGAAGVLVVTGAGNDGTDLDRTPMYPASSTSPAVIAVGASTGQDLPATYSGFGAESVDLFAPGEHIVGTLPGGGYGAFSGTSMATAMVSGAAALLWAATPAATAAEVKGALLDRSDGPNDGVTAFRSLAASDGRLNIGRSVYSRLFRPSAMFTFHDFNSFEPDVLHPVTIQAQTIDPWIAPPQTPSMYRAGLYVPYEGTPMAVVDHAISHTTSGRAATVRTDTTGRALIGDLFEPQARPQLVQNGDSTTISMALPAGTYAFVIEIVDVADPSAPVTQGDPSAVFFVVGIGGTVTEMPGTAIGSGGGATDATTDTPDPTAGPSGSTSTGGHGPPDDVATTDPSAATTTGPPDGTDTTDSSATMATPSTTPAPRDDDTGDPDEVTTTVASPTTTTGPPATVAAPANGVDASTTSSPDGTAPQAPTTTEAVTTTAPQDGMRITDVDPPRGPSAGGTLVTISGAELPDDPTVWFGDARASIVTVAAPTFIVVDAPAGRVGSVDVRVVDTGSGDGTVLADGFTYVGADEDGAVPTTVEGADPGAGDSTPAAPTTSHAAPTPNVSAGGDLDEWLDGMLVTPDGLTLAPLSGIHPLASIPTAMWAGALCNEPVCPGWVLGS